MGPHEEVFANQNQKQNTDFPSQNKTSEEFNCIKIAADSRIPQTENLG